MPESEESRESEMLMEAAAIWSVMSAQFVFWRNEHSQHRNRPLL